MFLYIIKLIIAGFLVFLNIFSFLLVKCQKNDREKLILQGVSKGNNNINFDDKIPQPSKEEQQLAKDKLQEDGFEQQQNDENGYKSTEFDMPKDGKQQKEEEAEILNKYSRKPVSDLKLLLCSLLGGALGIYIALFVFRYRLRDITMMVLVPTILVLNIYLYLQVFTVWIIVPGKPVAALFKL